MVLSTLYTHYINVCTRESESIFKAIKRTIESNTIHLERSYILLFYLVFTLFYPRKAPF